MRGKNKKADPQKAVIYCRVSSERQVREGDGLNSQEKSCRDYLAARNIPVAQVFKDEGVSGKTVERPAFNKMMAFLDKEKDAYYVAVYDVKRLARDMEAHIELITRLKKRNAILVSPTHNFGDGSADKLLTGMLALTAQFERETNAEQVKNRQRARLENGYWPFHQPLGYKFVKAPHGGKLLMPEEPMASAISEACNGYASGRFECQLDVAHFLAKSGAFKLDSKGRFHPSRVKGILINPLYAGLIEFPDWGVPRIIGKHKPLIDIQTFEKMQNRLQGKAKAPYRKDLREDFPLRGFVLCDACNAPLTASWCKGRNKKHAYYHCKSKGCREYGRSIKKEIIEDGFSNLLHEIAPSPPILELAQELTRGYWLKKQAQLKKTMETSARDVVALEEQTQGFLARLLKTDDPTMIELYEEQVKELQKKKTNLLAEAIMPHADLSFADALGTVFGFLKTPWKLWEEGKLDDKRLVLKLAFGQQLPFHRENGFGTVPTALPFTVFRGFAPDESGMVEGGGFEPPYS